MRSATPLCLLHCATNAMLCLRTHRHATNFGPELEITFHTTHPHGKKLMLCHEDRGELTATIPAAHLPANMFVLLTGSKVAELPLPQYATASSACANLLLQYHSTSIFLTDSIVRMHAPARVSAGVMSAPVKPMITCIPGIKTVPLRTFWHAYARVWGATRKQWKLSDGG